MTQEDIDKRIADLDKLYKDAVKKFTISSDSIQAVIPHIYEKRKNKKAVDAAEKYDNEN